MLSQESILEFTQHLLSVAQGCDDIREPDPSKIEASKAAIEELGRLRGRALIYPMMPTGKGAGPYVEMMDGSVKMDLICGIGVHLFGHGHPALTFTALKAALKATTMQGTLMPCGEYAKVCRLLLENANHVEYLGPEGQAKFSGAWLTTCGTMANELALKVIRQKKAPAFKLITFKNSFAGRSSTMQELTDEPKYREGQPTFDQFRHIDFFDPALGLEENIRRTCADIDQVLTAEPGLFCGIGFEIVQGEGGAFRSAPSAWWRAILAHAKSKGLAVWADEVQTFGRTGELFAYQRAEIADLIDVVSLAKPLQCAAILWTADYAPKPGLIAGTFAGSTVSLAVGAKIVEMLVDGDFLGPEGRIQQMERFIRSDLEERRQKWQRFGMGVANITGGMIAFPILDGKAETIKALLGKLYDRGLIAFSAGREPNVMLRFLPPMGVFEKSHWLKAMDILQATLEDFKHVSSA